MALTTKNTGMNVEFIKESTRGTAPGSGQLYRVSDGIENVNLVGRNNGEIIYSVYDYDGQGTIFGAEEYVLTFDYYLQRHDATNHPLTNSIEYYAVNRTAGNLDTLTFFLHTDSSSTFLCTGGVINSWSLTTEEKRLRCSAEIIFKSVVTTSTGYDSYTPSNACGTTFEQFQGASITRGTSFNAGVGNFTINISNNAEAIPVIGSSTPTNIYESFENLSGTVDILLNDGGESDFGVMKGQQKDSIVFASGTSTDANDKSMKWTFSNTHYSEIPINFTTDTRVVISGVNWNAETVTLVAYS